MTIFFGTIDELVEKLKTDAEAFKGITLDVYLTSEYHELKSKRALMKL